MSSGVEFDEDSFGQNRPQQSGLPAGSMVPRQFTNATAQPEFTGIVGWLIRHRLAKSPQGAQKILIGIVAINIIITFIMIKYYL